MSDEDLYVTEDLEDELDSDESSNRMFLFIMLGLGGLFACTLILIALYIFVIAPGASGAQQAANATAIAYNATATAVELTAQVTATPLPTDTPAPTNTPVPLTNTPVVVTPTLPPTPTETPGPPTQTPLVSPTAQPGATRVVAAAGTGTPGVSGQLADTGVGGMGLVVIAAGLVAMLFIARRLRMAQR